MDEATKLGIFIVSVSIFAVGAVALYPRVTSTSDCQAAGIELARVLPTNDRAQIKNAELYANAACTTAAVVGSTPFGK